MTPAEASTELRQYIAECAANPRLRENKPAMLGLLRAHSLLQQFSQLELWAQTGMIRVVDGRVKRTIPVEKEVVEILEREAFFMFGEFQKDPGGPWTAVRERYKGPT